MDRINILHVIATLDIGGAEKQLVELLKRLDKKKFNPIVCCLTRGGLLEKELKNANIEYFILGKRFKFDFSVVFRLMQILKERNIDILHTWMFTSNSFGRLAAIFSGTPIIIASERGMDYWKTKFHLFLDKLLSYRTDSIICVSEGVRNFYLGRAGISSSKLVRIYGGIDTTVRTEVEGKISRELGFDDYKSVVAFVGHLVFYKGIAYLLHAGTEIVGDFPNVVFLFVGEGPEKDKLKTLSRKLNISKKVVFAGIRDDVRETLAMTDVFVLPSLFEGLPNVIMEAMLAGKPVVATDIPGTNELVVNGETGLLVPPKDSNALASAIITLLKNPEEGKKMGIKGRQRIEKHFSIDKTVRKTEELYKSLAQEKLNDFPNEESGY